MSDQNSNPTPSPSLSGERLVNHLASPDLDREWLTLVVTWPSSFFDLLQSNSPDGLSGKTFPVSCQVTEDGTLAPSSGRWLSSGMGSPTEYWTLNTSEFPKDAVGSMLSDVLEIGDVPQRYYLSQKACEGILRRLGRKGIKLKSMRLLRLIQEVAGGTAGK